MRTTLLLMLVLWSVSLAQAQTTLTLGRALYFSQSGLAGDGLPYARFDEIYGIRFNSPNPAWVLSSKPSVLIGYNPQGQNWGNGNLYVSGNIGVGTSSPTEKLEVNGNIKFTSFSNNLAWANTGVSLGEDFGFHVVGDASHPVQIRSASLLVGYQQSSAIDRGTGNLFVSGNVGIGTASPSVKLEIAGNGGETTNLKVAGRIESGNGIYLSENNSQLIGKYSTSTIGVYNLGWRMFIDDSGNVGIGVDNPDEKLTVKGKIHTQEVKVDLEGSVAPDYVFEEDYDLRSLDEIRSYVQTNGHLPEIPSAAQMTEEGINLKEMNLLLLKKVEELTLYLLHQDTLLRAQEERFEKLELEIEALKSDQN